MRNERNNNILKIKPLFLGTIAKFTAEATCVDVSRDGINVVAGSADMTVQLINTETFQSKMFKGHEAPILNVALDPKMEYILSSSCDGTAKLWKIETSSCIKVSLFLLKTFSVLLKVESICNNQIYS